MTDQNEQKQAEQARKILARFRTLPSEQQVEGLRRQGIIDEQGQVVEPLNGHRESDLRPNH